MNRNLVLLLSVCSAVLLLIIGGEWGYTHYRQQHWLSTDGDSAHKTPLPEEMPSLNLTAQAEGSFVDLVERPLFLEGRRPVKEPPPEAKASDAVLVKFDWLLQGVYSTPHNLAVLLARATPLKKAKDNYRKLTTGALLDGWTLSTITIDRVLFTQGSDTKELLLHKAKNKINPAESAEQPPEEAPEQGEGGQPPPEGNNPEELMPAPDDLPEDIENNSHE